MPSADRDWRSTDFGFVFLPMTTQSPDLTRTRTRLAKVLCAAALLFCLAWVLVAVVIRPRMVMRDRLHRAMSIGLACRLYAVDHGGKFPETLPQLVPSYLPDAQFLAFPSRDGSHMLDYEYFGGTDTDPPDAVLLRVPPEQPGGPAVIVHADSSGMIRPTSNVR
jgi:hypothetical protein